MVDLYNSSFTIFSFEGLVHTMTFKPRVAENVPLRPLVRCRHRGSTSMSSADHELHHCPSDSVQIMAHLFKCSHCAPSDVLVVVFDKVNCMDQVVRSALFLSPNIIEPLRLKTIFPLPLSRVCTQNVRQLSSDQMLLEKLFGYARSNFSYLVML